MAYHRPPSSPSEPARIRREEPQTSFFLAGNFFGGVTVCLEESRGGKGDFSYDNKIKEQEHTGTVLFPEHVPGTPREIPSLVNTTKDQKIYESCHVTHE